MTFLTDLANKIKTWANGKFQPLLVSGTNIKTINSTSLLGSGDISIAVPTVVTRSSFSSSSSADIPDMTFNVAANQRFYVSFFFEAVSTGANSINLAPTVAITYSAMVFRPSLTPNLLNVSVVNSSTSTKLFDISTTKNLWGTIISGNCGSTGGTVKFRFISPNSITMLNLVMEVKLF